MGSEDFFYVFGGRSTSHQDCFRSQFFSKSEFYLFVIIVTGKRLRRGFNKLFCNHVVFCAIFFTGPRELDDTIGYCILATWYCAYGHGLPRSDYGSVCCLLDDVLEKFAQSTAKA
jgi:hypothetical protein